MFNILEWQAPDHDIKPKAMDWYISVLIIGFSVVIAALFLNNLLFAIFCLVSTLAIIIHVAKKPESIEVAITNQGIKVKHQFYPYNKIQSFWIEHGKISSDIIIHYNRPLLPHIRIPTGTIDPEDIRLELRRYIPEIVEHKNLIDKFVEYLEL